MLTLRSVSAAYGWGDNVIEDINIQVGPREIIALIGGNGAGKSTILRTITGLLHPSAGEVYFRDEPIHHLPPHRVARKGISCLPQRGRPFPEMTVHENLELGTYSRSWDPAVFAENVDFVFGLFPELKRRRAELARNLSGGQQQMLAMARALMSQPDLFLMDEPSLGLAPKLIVEVFTMIERLNQLGKTILLVEQNAYAALSIAHRGYVLENGRIALEGRAGDLIEDAYIRKTYLAA